MPELAELIVADRRAWRDWLSKHHDEPGVWLALAKKGTSSPTTLTYEDALAEALCHGWIDGQIRRGDERIYFTRFTPRRPNSRWSLRNTQLVEELARQGRLHPSGVAAMEEAKADGRWDDAYAGQRDIAMPDDFAAALRESAVAKAAYGRLTAQNRYALLYRLGRVSGEAQRRRRILEYVTMLEEGRTLHPQRRPLH